MNELYNALIYTGYFNCLWIKLGNEFIGISMQRHMSYNTDAVIENPLNFLLLIKLLIILVTFPPFFFASEPKHFICLEAYI